MNEVCCDCHAEIKFDFMKKRTRFSCEICDRPLCEKCGIVEVRDPTVEGLRRIKLPCRRCKSAGNLESSAK